MDDRQVIVLCGWILGGEKRNGKGRGLEGKKGLTSTAKDQGKAFSKKSRTQKVGIFSNLKKLQKGANRCSKRSQNGQEKVRGK